MTKYPAIDPYFYEISSNDGMSDDQIEEDWRAFIDGLNAFHSEVDKTHMENPPMPDKTPKSLKDLAKDIISKLPTFNKEPKHASS